MATKLRRGNVVRIVVEDEKQDLLVANGFEIVGLVDPTDAQLTAAQAKAAAAATQVTDIQNQEAATPVYNKIKALAKTIALGNAAAVVSARTDYNALTTPQKAIVVNYPKLTNAEVSIVSLSIAALPAVGVVALGDATAITAARTKYDALTAEQKALVTNYTTLTAVEAALAALH